MSERNILFLKHILDACENIIEFIKDINFETFKTNTECCN